MDLSKKIHNQELLSNASVIDLDITILLNTMRTKKSGSKKKRKKSRKNKPGKLMKTPRHLKKKLTEPNKKLLMKPKELRKRTKDNKPPLRMNGSRTKKRPLLKKELPEKNNSTEI